LAFANTFHVDADSPDAEAEKAGGADTFQARVDALNAKIEKAARRYTRGDDDVVVKLLEGLDKEIDALAAQYPKKKAKWMPGVRKLAAYVLLAATYRSQNELEKSGKYEALVKKPFKAIGQDVDLDEFLRLVLQDFGAEIPHPPTLEPEDSGPRDKD
jgi:hypothetical protein